jgi:hypothetical protein
MMKQKIILFSTMMICFSVLSFSQTKPVIEKKKITQKSAVKKTGTLSKSSNDIKSRPGSDSLINSMQSAIRAMPNKHKENLALMIP